MAHVEYTLLLAAGWLSLVWVDRRYRTGVVRRWRRLLPALVLTVACGLAWDCLGVHRGYWRSHPHRVLGFWPLPGVPVEEVALLALMAFAAIVLWQLIGLRLARRPRTESAAPVR